MLSYQTKEWMRIRHMKPAFSTDKISERDLAQIKGMFQQLDEDGSGTIELSELKDAMKMLGMTQDARSLIEQFKYMDSDGSGEIDFDEFAQMLSSTNKLHRLCDEQKVTQWMSSLISFAESLRRYKLLTNIADKRSEDDYRFRLFCDVFAVPSYLKEMREDQKKLEDEKDRQMHQAGAKFNRQLICHEPDFIKKITKCNDELMEIEDIAKESLHKSKMSKLSISRPKPPQSAPPSGRRSPFKLNRKHVQTPTTPIAVIQSPKSQRSSPVSNRHNCYSPSKSPVQYSRPLSAFKETIQPPQSPSPQPNNNDNLSSSRSTPSPSQLQRCYRPNRCSLITNSARIPSPRKPYTRSYSPFPPLTTQPYTVNELKVTMKSRRAGVCIPNLTSQKSPCYYQLHDSGAVTARV